MFDLICIFTKGGVVLWSKMFCTAGVELVNILIKNVILEEKTSMNQFVYQNYIFKWRLENQSGLIFAVIYQEVLQLMFVDDFMEMLRDDYMQKAYPKVAIRDGLFAELPDYDEGANVVMKRWQEYKEKSDQTSQMRTFGDTKRGQKIVEEQKKRDDADKKALAKKKKKEEEEHKAEEERKALEAKLEKEKLEKHEELAETPADRKKRAAMAAGKKTATSPIAKEDKTPKKDKDASPKKREKEMRSWGATDKVTAKDIRKIDASKAGNTDSMIEEKKKEFLGGEDDDKMKPFISDEGSVDLEESDKEEAKDTMKGKKEGKKKEGLFARFTNSIKGLTGHKAMAEEDLLPVLKDFRDNLTQKNVATEIADKICESVKTSLLTQKTAAFTTVKTTVKTALKEAIQRVLTPKVYSICEIINNSRNIDILKEAQNARARGVPYTIVFIGVNGVGKSTSLAKVAYYLKEKVI